MKIKKDKKSKEKSHKKLFDFKKTKSEVKTEEINPKLNKKKNKKIGWKIFKIALFVFIALCIVGTGIIVGVITGIIDKTESINLEDLALLKLTTFVYDKDGTEIGALYDAENRVTVEYKNIPKNLYNAVVSIEDERFETHHGVDIKRTLGAVFQFVINGGKSDFGGSTITQQLVKTITSDKETSWTRKIREWYRAYELENKLSKQQIFESYVNTIYLGDGAYGVVVAAENYFGKKLQDLNIAECASLAAIIQQPESYNPYRSEDAKAKLLARKDLVLSQMLKLGKITQAEYDEAKAYELVFKKDNVEATSKVQTYFVDAVVEAVIEDLMDQKNVTRGVALKMIYGDGYRIYSTQDSNIQKAIDDAYKNDKIFYADKDGSFMQSSMVVTDQYSGNILGLIGGAGEKTQTLVLNRATQTYRQPGSTMKPLGAYGPAFEQGIAGPGTGVDDCQLTDVLNWDPKNYYGYFNGYVTMREALQKSMNLPAIRTTKKVGIDYSFNFAKNCGLTDLVEQDKNLASLAIGGVTKGFTVLEMANAYSTFANGGLHVTPKLYTKVVDRYGKEVLVKESTAKRVMQASTAYMITDMLRSVVTSGTAAGYVKVGNMPIVGKTGETNNNYDQWFIGYTPYYTIACWNGYDQNKTINRAYPYVSIRLFNTVANAINGNLAVKQFEKPNNIVYGTICKASGLVPTDACQQDPRGGQVITDMFASGTVPTATCNIHKLVKICQESGKIANEYCPLIEYKSFITRDYIPNIKPRDWGFMAPTEVCTLHTALTVNTLNNSTDNTTDNTLKNKVIIYTNKP